MNKLLYLTLLITAPACAMVRDWNADARVVLTRYVDKELRSNKPTTLLAKLCNQTDGMLIRVDQDSPVQTLIPTAEVFDIVISRIKKLRTEKVGADAADLGVWVNE